MKKVKFGTLQVDDIFLREGEPSANKKIKPVHNEFGTWNCVGVGTGMRAKITDDEIVWVMEKEDG